MSDSLPVFRYHPDPLATGSIVKSDATCECCQKPRGYIYASLPYGRRDVEFVCPWCIADGSANRRLGASFVDDAPLLDAGVPVAVAEEVALRTPGYESWQQEEWMACCGDACEYHGDARLSDLQVLDRVAVSRISEDTRFSVEDLEYFIEHYTPKGSPAFYKFRCRHCGALKFNADCH